MDQIALSSCIHESCDPSNSTLRKPRFPSCAILFPRDIYPDESRDAIRIRRTLQILRDSPRVDKLRDWYAVYI